jgi:glycosyltransferase involved in cell wall biosynthesis
MKVAIINDADPRSGVGKYGYKLADSLSRSSDDLDVDLIQKQYSRKPDYPADSYIQGLKLPFLSRTLNDMLGLISFPNRGEYDVVHFNTLKGVEPREGDFITLHDIMPIKIPESYSRYHRWRFERNLRKTEGCNIICVSEETKKDFEEWKDFPVKNIFVIPNGVDEKIYRERPQSDAKQYFDLEEDRKYLLHVGSDEKRKNLSFLANLLEKLPKEYNLIRVGPETTELPKYRERVTYLKDLTEEEMAIAYNASEYLLLPSMYEGFGRPIIEALACNTQVIKAKENLPSFDSAIELELEVDKWAESILGYAEKQIEVSNYHWGNISKNVTEVYSYG